jgi:cell division protein FtsW
MVGMVCLLIVKQPELGTAIMVAITALAVFYLAGANMLHLALAGLGSVSVAALLAHSESYRSGRLTAFLNPWSDPTGVGYHTIQALLALRYGGLFGRGLGNSIQKNVLPAPHTDSILAVIGEEWGLVGAVAVLLLFLLIAYRGMRIAARAPDTFGKLLAAGITSWITFQALMNFAVITSSVPFTGVPLPFVSYGGSSLIISMAAVGILLNVSRHASGAGFASSQRTIRTPAAPARHGRGERRARVPRVIHHPAPRRAPGTHEGYPYHVHPREPIRR